MRNNTFIKFLVVVLFFPLNLHAQTDIYVSVNDTSHIEDGTLQNPFKTIQQASNVSTYGSTIHIREGVYREQVGITSNGVTYQSYNNEKVIVNGTEKLMNWTLESGSTYKTTDMDWDLLPLDGGNQLFVDQVMINSARWPDQTSTNLIAPTDAVVDAATISGNSLTLTCSAFNEPDERWVGAQIWLNLSVNGHDGQGWTGSVTATNAAAHGLKNSTITNRGVARIHHNKISNAMRRSWDSGALDVVGQDGNWVRIDHNLIFNTVPDGLDESSRYAIYLDFGKTYTEKEYPGRYIIDHNLM